jgi:FixJ family two-component response regulator
MSIGLAPRQRQVRDKMMLGWTSRQIAAELGISVRTAESHRRVVLHKHKVKNAVQLLRKVYRIGEMA